MAERHPFKLIQARDARGNTISARQIGQHPEPFTRPLTCAYCNHEVTTQPEQHRISSLGKPYTRSAHFALAKEKDGQPAEHLPHCPLRTDHTLHAIARRSEGLAQLHGDRLQLRLVLAATTDTKLGQQPPIGGPVLPPHPDPANIAIHTTEPPLPPAVTSAVRIAQLLALHGNDPDHLTHITVKHPGLRTPIPWERFCYGPNPDHLAQLYHRLTTSTIRHPIAVLGEVTDTRQRGNTTSCRLTTHIPTGLPGDLAHADIYLRANAHRRQLLDPLTPGTRVLALAAPDVAWNIWKPTSTHLGHQIVLWPAAHWQLAHWNLTDTGLPTPPRTPNPLTEPAPPRRRTTPRARPTTSKQSRRTPSPKKAQLPPIPPPPRTPTPKAARPQPTDAAQPQQAAKPPPPEPTSPPEPVIPPRPTAVPKRSSRAKKGLFARWRRRRP